MATEKGFQDLSKRKTARVLTELDLQIIMARIDELEASAVPRTQFVVTSIPGELDLTGLRIVFTEHSTAPLAGSVSNLGLLKFEVDTSSRHLLYNPDSEKFQGRNVDSDLKFLPKIYQK